jgi:hypothetical protein
MLVHRDSIVAPTKPKPRVTYSEDGTFELPPTHTLPGCTVDAFLRQGKREEAHEELERLIQLGIDSGPAILVTPQFWEDMLAEVHGREPARA